MGQPQALRRLNRQQIIELLFQHGSLTRPQLAERSRLSKVTVNAVVQELQDYRLVTLLDGASQGCGRVPQQVQLHTRLGQLLGADIQRGKLLFQQADLSGQQVRQGEMALGADLNQSLLTFIQERAAQTPLSTVVLGIPAPVEASGAVAEPNALPELEPLRLQRTLQAQGISVTFENDANLAALAAAQRFPEFSHLAVLLERGSGTGLGLILAGELYRGATGRAGELGRTPWPVPQGHEPLEQLSDQRRRSATAYALAGLIHTLDLEHVLIGGESPDELLDLLAGLLPSGVGSSTESSCAELVQSGAAILALALGREALRQRLNGLEGSTSPPKEEKAGYVA